MSKAKWTYTEPIVPPVRKEKPSGCCKNPKCGAYMWAKTKVGWYCIICECGLVPEGEG